MFHAFDRRSRTAAITALAAALIWVPLTVAPANARSGDGAPLQLAQASRQGGAKAPAAAPPGGGEVDKQIADLKKQLKITPQQEPQFNAFAEVMRSNAQELDAQMSKGSANPNAVEELKQAQQFAEIQAAQLKRLVPALQALYDTLSDPQKKTADQVMGGGGGGPGGGGPGGAPGGPPPAPRGGRG